MVRKSFLVLIVMAFLVGCGGGNAEKPESADPSVFAVKAGTLNYGDRLGVSFMFEFNLENVPSSDTEVKIYGPSGWNGGEASRRIYKYSASGRKATWLSVFKDNNGDPMEAVSGTYVLQAQIDSKTYRKEIAVDTSSVLAKPLDIKVTGSSATEINLSWGAVAGAESYLVELFETSDTNGAFAYTTSNEAKLSNLQLEAGRSYRIGVTALTANFTDGSPKALPEGDFNTSFASIRFDL